MDSHQIAFKFNLDEKLLIADGNIIDGLISCRRWVQLIQLIRLVE